MGEPIAVVGVGCRFPGAYGPDELWTLLRSGRDALTEVPAGRFDVAAVYDPRPATPGRIPTRAGGFLDRIDEFDAEFFGISAREAAHMDPQQRLLLETGWEAVEDAGLLPGPGTGVFIGQMTSNYWDLVQRAEALDIYANIGNTRSALAGRLSFALDARGPSVAIDTACSSSLVAVHLAVQSLRRGECDVALAGGVNLILHAAETITFAQAKMISPRGRCAFGSETADGFIRSDGVAVVVLKPLARALADGDSPYAVILGSAVGNDGRASGLLMTPAPDGQAATIRAACADAGIDPAEVSYIEAHGTGSAAGDPAELAGLAQVFPQPLLVGSIKTNIGHTEAAAGLAGLIKAMLAVSHREIPASLHGGASPATGGTGITLVRELTPWPAGVAVAGVSSFGISGTNAHVLVGEFVAPAREPEPVPESVAVGAAVPEPESVPAGEAGPATGSGPGPGAGPQLLVLSAHTPEALRDLAAAYAVHPLTPLGDVCHTAAARRRHHEHRLTVVGSTPDEIAGRLRAYLAGEPVPLLGTAAAGDEHRPRIAYVFPGQGAQWHGMGRDLLRHSRSFRAAMAACDAAVRAEAGWSVLEAIEGAAELSGVERIQPTLWAVQVALAAVWRGHGIEPDVVIGHSMGEVAAACVAGLLDLADGAAVICRRAGLLATVAGQGAMLAVELPEAEAYQEIADVAARVCVAVSNGPGSTVLSGEPAALDAIAERLARRDVFCRRVNVDVASHSPQMDPLLEPLTKALGSLTVRPGTTPLHSTVLGREVTTVDADYWAANLRDPVHFGQAVRAQGRALFIELSPHPLLAPAITEALGPGRAIASGRRGEPGTAAVLDGLGALYRAGCPVPWQRVYGAGHRAARLPRYPWQRRRHWLAEPAEPPPGARELPEGLPEYLLDHRVQGESILPGTAYLELALSAAAPGRGLREVAFHRPFVLTGDPPPLRVTTTPDRFEISGAGVVYCTGGYAPGPAAGPVRREVARRGQRLTGEQFYARSAADGNDWSGAFRGIAELWREDGCALGRIAPPPGAALPAVLDACLQVLAAAGPGGPFLLAGIGSVRVYGPLPDTPLWSSVTASAAAGTSPSGGFPSGGGTSPGDGTSPGGGTSRGGSTSPRGGFPSGGGTSPGDGTPPGGGAPPGGGTLTGDVVITDPDGAVVAELTGVRLHYLDGAPPPRPGLFHEVRWIERPRPAGDPAPLPAPGAAPDPTPGRWVVFADAAGVGGALAGRLRAHGAACVVVTAGGGYSRRAADEFVIDPASAADYRRVLAAAPGVDVVHLWSIDAPAATESVERALRLAQASPAGRLWLVTRGAQPAAGATVSPDHAAIWGFGRALAREWPDRQVTLIDLEPSGVAGLSDLDLSDAGGRSNPGSCDVDGLYTEVTGQPDGETEVALRAGRRFVPRLVPYRPAADRAAGSTVDKRAATERCATVEAGTTVEIGTDAPGLLDAVRPRPVARAAPGPGAVEIATRSAALNYRDVLFAMDAYPGQGGAPARLGWECAGTVTAVGAGVAGVGVGDEVVALSNPALAGHVLADARLVFPRPPGLGPAEAAALPVAYLTAYYGLCDLARIQPGERVLIHCATGGVGLAAIQVARWRGAEVLATAGSGGKRALLRMLGVRDVFNSRSLAFADGVRAATRGAGVDVVLNTLTGGAVAANLSLLAPYGRYVELAKRDLIDGAGLDLRPFARNLSYFAVDVADMIQNRPTPAARIMGEVLRLVEAGVLTPLPYTEVPAAQAVEAFRRLARAQHTGKVVVSFAGADLPGLDSGQSAVLGAGGEHPVIGGVVGPGRATGNGASTVVGAGGTHPVIGGVVGPGRATAGGASTVLGAGGTYLVTGGLGDLGRLVARWLVDRGARHLLLIGRTARPEDPLPAELARRGATVAYETVDVADEAALRGLLERRAGAGAPPVRGVVHAAGEVLFRPIDELTADELARVLRPKVAGGWALHRALRHAPLDFFVLFSSGSAVLGSPMLAAYAAANAFLDGLAHHRRAAGLPALAIDWGYWTATGMAARFEAEHGRSLIPHGMAGFTPREGLDALGALMSSGCVQAQVLPADWQHWRAAHPRAAGVPMLRELFAEPAAGQGRVAAPDRATGPSPETVAGSERVAGSETAAGPAPTAPQQAAGPQPATVPAPEPAEAAAGAGPEPAAVDALAGRSAEEYLVGAVAAVLGVPARRVSTRRPLTAQGIDSLMAVELRTRVRRDLNLLLSVSRVLAHRTITELAGDLTAQLPGRPGE